MNKDINEYLNKLLIDITIAELTVSDKKAIARDLPLFITNKIIRKKFRRRKLAEETRIVILEKVSNSIKNKKPLHLVIPFGGYKHFWNESHPEPDWAELFNFRYLTDLVAPILKAYKYGVIIEYMSEDLILTRMNNYPQKAIDEYSNIFSQLIKWYNKHTPANLEFRYFRVKDKVNSSELINTVELMLPERRKEFDKLPNEQKEKELHRSYRSMIWNGEKDLTNLTQEQKHERIIDSRLIELAYYETEEDVKFMGEYLSGDNHIAVLFSFGTTQDNDEYQDLTIGSTYGSLVDYWIGKGVLFEHSDSYRPSIVSKKQYSSLSQKIEKYKINNLLPFRNFQEIDVVS